MKTKIQTKMKRIYYLVTIDINNGEENLIKDLPFFTSLEGALLFAKRYKWRCGEPLANFIWGEPTCIHDSWNSNVRIFSREVY